MNRYEVRKEGTLVLTFSDQPGVLLSQATRPPGFSPPRHPFLDAQARDARFEDRLGDLLAKAASSGQFIALLGRDGFEVIRG